MYVKVLLILNSLLTEATTTDTNYKSLSDSYRPDRNHVVPLTVHIDLNRMLAWLGVLMVTYI